MKRILVTVSAALAISGCAVVRYHSRPSNPYVQPPFYAKYLNPAVQLDRRIQQDVDALRANPNDAALHNDLGRLLQQKGFPKDAELEFERAVNADSHFYPAWYNLGLMRSARGDTLGSRIAFSRAVHYKPGHAAALFQMGLVEERSQHAEAAIDYYAKAFLINHDLLDVKVNPQLLDSKLVDRALLKAYPKEHAREAVTFQPAPPEYGVRASAVQTQAPSNVPPAEQIVPPAPPVTDPSRQTPAPTPPSVPPPPS